MNERIENLDLRTVAQQALEAWRRRDYDIGQYMEALASALAQQEQAEPVAWQVHPFDYGIGHKGVYAMTQRLDQVKAWERKGWTVQPLYTHPPRREWVSLTDEEIDSVTDAQWAANNHKPIYAAHRASARAIEAKLKEKNT